MSFVCCIIYFAPQCFITNKILQIWIKSKIFTKPGKRVQDSIENRTNRIEPYLDSHIIKVQNYDMTSDSPMYRVMRNILANRRFYVEMNSERGRRRIQINELPRDIIRKPTICVPIEIKYM